MLASQQLLGILCGMLDFNVVAFSVLYSLSVCVIETQSGILIIPRYNVVYSLRF